MGKDLILQLVSLSHSRRPRSTAWSGRTTRRSIGERHHIGEAVGNNTMNALSRVMIITGLLAFSSTAMVGSASAWPPAGFGPALGRGSGSGSGSGSAAQTSSVKGCSNRGAFTQGCVDSRNAAKRIDEWLEKDRQARQKREDEDRQRLQEQMHKRAEEHRQQVLQDAWIYPGMPSKPSRTLQRLSR